jgi:hypothetical protein
MACRGKGHGWEDFRLNGPRSMVCPLTDHLGAIKRPDWMAWMRWGWENQLEWPVGGQAMDEKFGKMRE